MSASFNFDIDKALDKADMPFIVKVGLKGAVKAMGGVEGCIGVLARCLTTVFSEGLTEAQSQKIKAICEEKLPDYEFLFDFYKASEQDKEEGLVTSLTFSIMEKNPCQQ